LKFRISSSNFLHEPKLAVVGHHVIVICILTAYFRIQGGVCKIQSIQDHISWRWVRLPQYHALRHEGFLQEWEEHNSAKKQEYLFPRERPSQSVRYQTSKSTLRLFQ